MPLFGERLRIFYFLKLQAVLILQSITAIGICLKLSQPGLNQVNLLWLNVIQAFMMSVDYASGKESIIQSNPQLSSSKFSNAVAWIALEIKSLRRYSPDSRFFK